MPAWRRRAAPTRSIVSNHGGRQLDGAPSSISALPKIAEAVGNEIEVMVDGGIRSGQDVLRALALGARSCMIGRSYIYGLGAGGEAGVAKAIEIIGKELDVTMALTGTQERARHRPAGAGERRAQRAGFLKPIHQPASVSPSVIARSEARSNPVGISGLLRFARNDALKDL